MPSHIPAHPLLLVPLNCSPDPVLLSPVPGPLPPAPGPSWVHSEAGGVRVRPRSPVLLELLPHPQTHTHTPPQRKPLLSANLSAPPNVGCLPSARTPTPPWGPGLGLCPGPEGCPSSFPCTQSQPSVLRPAAAEATTKARHPRARLAGTGQSTAGVGRRGPRAGACPRRCRQTDGPPPRPEPLDPRGAGPRTPARLCSRRKRRLGPARYSRCPRGGPSWDRGGSLHPLPLCAPTRPRAAHPGGRLGPRASLPVGPGPRPQPGARHAAAPPAGRPGRPPRPAPPSPRHSPGRSAPDSSPRPAPSPELVRVSPPPPGPPRPRLLPSRGPGQVRRRPARPSVSPPAAPSEEVLGREEDARGGRPESGSLRGERAAGFTAPRLEGPRPTGLRAPEPLGKCLFSPDPTLRGSGQSGRGPPCSRLRRGWWASVPAPGKAAALV